MIINTKIRTLRREKNWSQADLAQKIGTRPHVISYYENGKTVPSLEALVKLADVFGVTLDYLVNSNINEKAQAELKDKELLDYFKKVQNLDDESKEALKDVLRSFLVGKQILELKE